MPPDVATIDLHANFICDQITKRLKYRRTCLCDRRWFLGSILQFCTITIESRWLGGYHLTVRIGDQVVSHPGVRYGEMSGTRSFRTVRECTNLLIARFRHYTVDNGFAWKLKGCSEPLSPVSMLSAEYRLLVSRIHNQKCTTFDFAAIKYLLGPHSKPGFVDTQSVDELRHLVVRWRVVTSICADLVMSLDNFWVQDATTAVKDKINVLFTKTMLWECTDRKIDG